MIDQSVPEFFTVSRASLTSVAVEYWRLSSWLSADRAASSSGSAPVRYALRKLEDFLRQLEIEVQSLDGRAYDPGLAARVVDSTDDPALPKGVAVIAQTVSPLVLWRGQVIRPAEVVVNQNL